MRQSVPAAALTASSWLDLETASRPCPPTSALWSSDLADLLADLRRRADRPGLLRLDHVVEPALDVGGLEAQAVGGEQLLALLAEPGLEQVRRCTRRWKPKVDLGLGGDLGSDVDQRVPGPGHVVGHVHPGLLEDLRVGQDDQALMPALMPYSVSLILPESTVPSTNLEVSTLGQVEQGLPVAVLGDVGHVHLDDVRRGVAGGLGGQLVPVARSTHPAAGRSSRPGSPSCRRRSRWWCSCCGRRCPTRRTPGRPCRRRRRPHRCRCEPGAHPVRPIVVAAAASPSHRAGTACGSRPLFLPRRCGGKRFPAEVTSA